MVGKYTDSDGLKVVAPSYHRTFVCDKEYFEAHKDEIPDGTMIYITDDAKETLEQVEQLIENLKQYVDDKDDEQDARLDALEETSSEDSPRIDALEEDKLNKPLGSSSSNRVLTYSGDNNTAYRDLSTIRAAVSGGILYLYDN